MTAPMGRVGRQAGKDRIMITPIAEFTRRFWTSAVARPGKILWNTVGRTGRGSRRRRTLNG